MTQLGRPTFRPWWADAVVATIMGSVTVVVCLWLRNRGLQALWSGDVGATLSSLGRLSALISADLLLIQVLLMARVPWVERGVGRDVLIRWHRLVGFTSIWFLLGHLVLTTVGYALLGKSGVLGELVELVLTYPGMLLAAGAVLALGLAVPTSIRSARRRLDYESWHLLHLYAYLGVGLALPHELWTGTDFVASDAAQLYWKGLFVLTGGLTVVYRVLLPILLNLRHGLRVERVVKESPGVHSVWLKGRHLDRLRAQAGQFLTLRFTGGPGWTRANPYSLSAVPTDTRLRVTVKDLGPGSRRAVRLQPGARVFFEGPFGALTHARRGNDTRAVAYFACGIGITPMRALLEDLDLRDVHAGAVLVYRIHDPVDLSLKAEIERIAHAKSAQVFYLVGARKSATSWLPDSAAGVDELEAIRQLLPAGRRTDVYMCGPERWMDAVTASALGVGVPAAQIHSESFAW